MYRLGGLGNTWLAQPCLPWGSRRCSAEPAGGSVTRTASSLTPAARAAEGSTSKGVNGRSLPPSRRPLRWTSARSMTAPKRRVQWPAGSSRRNRRRYQATPSSSSWPWASHSPGTWTGTGSRSPRASSGGSPRNSSQVPSRDQRRSPAGARVGAASSTERVTCTSFGSGDGEAGREGKRDVDRDGDGAGPAEAVGADAEPGAEAAEEHPVAGRRPGQAGRAAVRQRAVGPGHPHRRGPVHRDQRQGGAGREPRPGDGGQGAPVRGERPGGGEAIGPGWRLDHPVPAGGQVAQVQGRALDPGDRAAAGGHPGQRGRSDKLPTKPARPGVPDGQATTGPDHVDEQASGHPGDRPPLQGQHPAGPGGRQTPQVDLAQTGPALGVAGLLDQPDAAGGG